MIDKIVRFDDGAASDRMMGIWRRFPWLAEPAHRPEMCGSDICWFRRLVDRKYGRWLGSSDRWSVVAQWSGKY